MRCGRLGSTRLRCGTLGSTRLSYQVPGAPQTGPIGSLLLACRRLQFHGTKQRYRLGLSIGTDKGSRPRQLSRPTTTPFAHLALLPCSLSSSLICLVILRCVEHPVSCMQTYPTHHSTLPKTPQEPSPRPNIPCRPHPPLTRRSPAALLYAASSCAASNTLLPSLTLTPSPISKIPAPPSPKTWRLSAAFLYASSSCAALNTLSVCKLSTAMGGMISSRRYAEAAVRASGWWGGRLRAPAPRAIT